MEVDTPLADVAALLSVDTAQILLCQPYEAQVRCLELVRAYVVAVEEHDVVLDPIMLQEYTGAVVAKELDVMKGHA